MTQTPDQLVEAAKAELLSTLAAVITHAMSGESAVVVIPDDYLEEIDNLIAVCADAYATQGMIPEMPNPRQPLTLDSEKAYARPDHPSPTDALPHATTEVPGSMQKELEALRKFLSGVEPNVDQIGINAPTYGWGECGASGQWEYPVHPALVQLKREARSHASYMELIYEVAKVYPGETRHETARRIIRQNQTEPSGGNQAATEVSLSPSASAARSPSSQPDNSPAPEDK